MNCQQLFFYRFRKQLIYSYFLLIGATTFAQNKTPNALIKESSPYLLEHAYNPVQWQRWNATLYQKENRTKKLVVVSIGYSSCHWCHVMEEETFEDKEVADLMNTQFINIKVDREENPDVDNIYMTAVQLMTGSGGWPLNVICLPDGRPIYGGTYHTKEQWIKVLQQTYKIYQNNPQRLIEFANQIQQGIRQVNTIQLADTEENFDIEILKREMQLWKQQWDYEYGGERRKQKFISPTKFNYLLHYTTLFPDQEVENHLKHSLKTIANSGIFDHLEGGFFRYSVDPYWNIPHFEKMLYDNAQVLQTYARAYKQFKNPLFKSRVYQTFNFLTQTMEDQKGGFYAAIDADNSEGEGRYYLWTKEELETALGPHLNLFTNYYGIDFEQPFEGHFYLLKQATTDTPFLKANELTAKTLSLLKSRWQQQLKDVRKTKEFPKIDKKIITSWNALAVVGLIEAYEAFKDSQFLDKAISIFDFILSKAYNNKRLFHTYQKGQPKIKGFLEDYAYTIKAALALYKSTLNRSYLDRALALSEYTLKNFADADSPYFTFKENQPLLSKIISVDDGVLPSPNAVMADNLWTLSQFLGRKDFNQKTIKMLNSIQPFLIEGRSDYTYWAQLLAKETTPHFEVIIVGPKAKTLAATLNSNYLPNILFQASTTESELPLLKDRFYPSETFIYVCKNYVCLRPVKTVVAALKQIKNWK